MFSFFLHFFAACFEVCAAPPTNRCWYFALFHSFGFRPVSISLIRTVPTAVRVYIDRAGRPEGREGDEETVHAFGEANRGVLRKLREELPATIAWVEFLADRTDEAGGHRGPMLRLAMAGGRALDEVSEELTPVMTRLGPADLATVDTLITAGVATSRAEVLRWALGASGKTPPTASSNNGSAKSTR